MLDNCTAEPWIPGFVVGGVLFKVCSICLFSSTGKPTIGVKHNIKITGSALILVYPLEDQDVPENPPERSSNDSFKSRSFFYRF